VSNTETLNIHLDGSGQILLCDENALGWARGARGVKEVGRLAPGYRTAVHRFFSITYFENIGVIQGEVLKPSRGKVSGGPDDDGSQIGKRTAHRFQVWKEILVNEDDSSLGVT
jgi:hypothetical protein